jgi:REP element-mobilizing transposase RayT
MLQQKFGLSSFKIKKAYGGSLRKKAANRGARPLCTKRSIHLILWSSEAKGAKSFIKNRRVLELTLSKIAKRFGVKIYRIGNAGNHIHLVVKLTNRYLYSGFIRALTGTLALKLRIKWDFRPYTRIIEWGRDFKTVCEYVFLNQLEGVGAIPYSSTRLRGVNLKLWLG